MRHVKWSNNLSLFLQPYFNFFAEVKQSYYSFRPWFSRVNLIESVRGSQVGVAVITRASHLCNAGSTPGLRTWAEIC